MLAFTSAPLGRRVLDEGESVHARFVSRDGLDRASRWLWAVDFLNSDGPIDRVRRHVL